MPGAIRWAAQVLSARGSMSSQVEQGTVAFGVTLGVPSQGGVLLSTCHRPD